MTKRRIIAALAFLIHLQTAFVSFRAHGNSPAIWGSPYPIMLGKGGLRFKRSDPDTACDAASAGSLRYNEGTFEGCNGTAWASLGGGAGGGVASIASANNGFTASSTTGALTVGLLPHVQGFQNCAITASATSNTLIVTLLNNAQATPTASAPCLITFRNETATNGLLSQVAVSSAASVTAAIGSSLGCAPGAVCPVHPYAIKVGSNVELGLVAWKNLDEGTAQTSTAAGTTANTIGGFYSLTSRASAPVRLLGEVQVTVNANGSWANTPVRIATVPFKPYLSDWTDTTPTVTPSSGTISNTTLTGKMRRVGQNLEINGNAAISGATGTWSRFQINTPANCTIDTVAMVGGNDVMPLGRAIALGGQAADFALAPFYSNGRYVIEGWQADATPASGAIRIVDISGTFPRTWQANDKISWHVSLPCVGW